MNEKPGRTVRAWNGWVVVSRHGHLFTGTICSLRRDAIEAYGGSRMYAQDRRRFGVQVVRCSITTGDERT